jgi:hypothetical protein
MLHDFRHFSRCPHILSKFIVAVRSFLVSMSRTPLTTENPPGDHSEGSFAYTKASNMQKRLIAILLTAIASVGICGLSGKKRGRRCLKERSTVGVKLVHPQSVAPYHAKVPGSPYEKWDRHLQTEREVRAQAQHTWNI